MLAELGNRGYKVIGICPDLPEYLQKTHSEKELGFELYSDSSVELAEKFGLAFHVADEMVSMYLEKFNIDIEKASGEKHHNLPVPAVYIADTRGAVKFVYYNADHTTRLSNDELLAKAT